jgi:uncharacterized protein
VGGLAATAVFLYLLLLSFIWWKQEKLLFVPTVLPADFQFPKEADVSEYWIEVSGAKLNTLHLKRSKPKAIVYFLHGNAGSLSNWFVNIDFYRQLNVDLVMVDYRGFGKSHGAIKSESQLLADVDQAWRFILAQNTHYANLPKVFIGRSLGSGLAAKLTATLPLDQRPNSLVLVSPYFSLQELASIHFWYVPSFLVRYPMRTDLALNQIQFNSSYRLSLIHGEKDPLIPIDHSRRLATLVPSTEFFSIDNAAHNDLQEYPAYTAAIAKAIDQSVK